MQETNQSAHNFEQCMKCTICTAYCPLVPVNPLFPGPKQGGPDGERLRLKGSFYFDENLKYCMNCKRCETACPSGVRIADLIHSARMEHSRRRPSLRDRILAHTDFVGKAARPFAPIVNSALKVKPVKAVMDSVLGIPKERDFPAYQPHGFRAWFRKHRQERQGQYRRQVSFFHGCSTEFQHPETGRAFVEVMNALGYGVRLLDEKCCGVAMISNGLFEEARRNAAHNLAVFEEAVRPILTVSSTCTLTLRDEYPNILKIDNAGVRGDICLVEKFLCTVLDSGAAKAVFNPAYRARAAYHIPCHLEKLGWSLFTQELLGMIPGLELTVLDSNCCGIAGTYGFKKENYAHSQAIGQPLFDQIRAVDPAFVVCECETCKWQIEMSTGYSVVNPIVLLADALDLEATARANAG